TPSDMVDALTAPFDTVDASGTNGAAPSGERATTGDDAETGSDTFAGSKNVLPMGSMRTALADDVGGATDVTVIMTLFVSAPAGTTSEAPLGRETVPPGGPMSAVTESGAPRSGRASSIAPSSPPMTSCTDASDVGTPASSELQLAVR